MGANCSSTSRKPNRRNAFEVAGSDVVAGNSINGMIKIRDEGSKRPVAQIKVVLIGASGAGKTTYAKRLQDPNAPSMNENSAVPTIGIDFIKYEVPDDANLKFNGLDIVCLIWDTAGQERTNAMTGSCLREAALVIGFIDINQAESTSQILEMYLNKVLEASPYAFVAIYISKHDLYLNHDGSFNENSDKSIAAVQIVNSIREKIIDAYGPDSFLEYRMIAAKLKDSTGIHAKALHALINQVILRTKNRRPQSE
jgi:small GTP-binding protein